MTYKEMITSYTQNPRDVHTIPMMDKPQIWFRVYVENWTVYVDRAQNHTPSSRMKNCQKLKEDELESMLEIYNKRKRGISVSQEAKEVTWCQVYWYGIFSDLGL